MSQPHEQDGTLTRRRFVAGTLATGAAVAVPSGAEAAPRHRRKRSRGSGSVRHADVAIVGAGYAGLTAAREIARAGHSVVVLEARDRVGGRAWNEQLSGGAYSDRGATFVGPTQDAILGLLKELGIPLFDTYDTGNDLYLNPPERLTYSDTGPTGTAPPDPTITPEIVAVVERLDQMSTQVPVDAPWEAPNAGEYESYTLERWIKENSATPRFQALVPVATRPIFGAEPRELSLLFVLFYIAASGDERNPGTFERNFDTRNGAQQWRPVGGAQRAALEVAASLEHDVVLGSPVRRIVQGRGGVTVHSDHLTLKARQAIVAVPPALSARIDYEPILPFQRDQLTQRYGQGTLTKVAAVYERPFWREAGYSGQVIDVGGFPVAVSFDDSPPTATADRGPGVLFGFVGGDSARQYATLSPAARRQAVLRQYANWYGSEALKATDFFETAWSGQQWTRGCPVGIPATGALLAYGPWLRQPVGRIHWAGTETSSYWNGYMDGAVRSGERAAAEVLAEL
jgi:monoamine oxidase